MGIARLVSTIPSMTWRRRNIDPVGELWMTRDTRLFFTAWNKTAGVWMTIFVRVRELDGKITSREETFELQAGRLQGSLSINIGSLFLLSIYGYLSGPNVRRGECYVQFELRDSPRQRSRILLADYMDTQTALGWPGGRSVASIEGPGVGTIETVAAPASATETSYTVASLKRQRIIGGSVILTTAAPVANREVVILLDDGAHMFYTASSGIAHVASKAIRYSFGEGAQTGALLLASIRIPLPSNCFMNAGYRLRIQTQNMQAGDQWGVMYLHTEEWLEV